MKKREFLSELYRSGRVQSVIDYHKSLSKKFAEYEDHFLGLLADKNDDFSQNRRSYESLARSMAGARIEELFTGYVVGVFSSYDNPKEEIKKALIDSLDEYIQNCGELFICLDEMLRDESLYVNFKGYSFDVELSWECECFPLWYFLKYLNETFFRYDRFFMKIAKTKIDLLRLESQRYAEKLEAVLNLSDEEILKLNPQYTQEGVTAMGLNLREMYRRDIISDFCELEETVSGSMVWRLIDGTFRVDENLNLVVDRGNRYAWREVLEL